MTPPLTISGGDDRQVAQHLLAEHLVGIADRFAGSAAGVLWVAPSPHDVHHGHEGVGRAVVDAVETCGAGTCLLWGLWGDVAFPTLYVPFDDVLMSQALHALEAYAGEVDRVDYLTMVKSRAAAAVALGSERIFGFGSASASSAPYADLLGEVVFSRGRWLLGSPHVWPADPSVPPVEDVGWWLHAQSLGDRRRAARSE